MESLESRVVPTTLPVNATHSFLSQLAAATPGATLQIEPGATIGIINVNAGSVVNSVLAGSSSVLSTESYSPGQVITITTSGNVDTAVVNRASPDSGSYLLTLNAPLQFDHESGDVIAPLSNVIGIDKAVIISGDFSKPKSTLLNGMTVELFPQTGLINFDVLRHLSLTAVTGTSGGDLSLDNDTFNIVSGTTAPIAVTSEADLTLSNDIFSIGGSVSLPNVIQAMGSTSSDGGLTISNDTFTIGSSASVQDVVQAGTNFGSISFVNNKINVEGQVTSDGVLLSSNYYAPIALASDSLMVKGMDSNSGIVLETKGNVTVNSTVLNLSEAETGIALNVSGDNCNLSSITVTAGSSLSSALQVNASGTLTMSGTNRVTVAGQVDTGINLFSNGIETVSNLTAQFKSDVSLDAMDSIGVEESKVNNVKLTVFGRVGETGLALGSLNYDDGPSTSNNITVNLDDGCQTGIAVTGANSTLAVNTLSLTVTGPIADDGLWLGSNSGSEGINTSNIKVDLRSAVVFGIDAFSGSSVVKMKGTTLEVSGNVSNTGIAMTGGIANLQNATVQLDGTSVDGVSVQASAVTVSGLHLDETGAVANAGVAIENSGWNVNSANYITSTISSSSITLDGTSAFGLQDLAGGDEIVTGVKIKQALVVASTESGGFDLQNNGGKLSIINDSVTISDGLTGTALTAECTSGTIVMNNDHVIANTKNLANDVGIFTLEQRTLVLDNSSVELVGATTHTATADSLNSESGTPPTLANDQFSSS